MDRRPHERRLHHHLDRDVGDLQVRVRVLEGVLAGPSPRPSDRRSRVRRSARCTRGCAARSSRRRRHRRCGRPRTRSWCRPRTASRTRRSSTRSCTPDSIRCAATIAVEPPTLPAVCTRMIGLPAAPSASARYSSGIITPSKMSGALPITTASMSSHVISASSSARIAASRHRPAIETSARHLRQLRLPDPDDRATFGHDSPTLQDADEVLLQAGTGGRVAERAVLAVLADLPERLADADEAR